MKAFVLSAILLGSAMQSKAVNLAECTIVSSSADAPLVTKMSKVMRDDIERVTGESPHLSGSLQTAGKDQRDEIVLATVDGLKKLGLDGFVDVSAINGGWEHSLRISSHTLSYVSGPMSPSVFSKLSDDHVLSPQSSSLMKKPRYLTEGVFDT